MKLHNPSSMWQVPPEFSRIYSHGVEVECHGFGRQLHVAGQIGIAPDGTVAADFEQQCERAMRNAEEVLRAASMTLQDVVRTTYYLVRREDLSLLSRIRASRWPNIRPAVTTLLIAGLARPELLVEVEVQAYRAATGASQALSRVAQGGYAKPRAS